MDCLRCNSRTKVTETRSAADGGIQRRRTCEKCGERYVTIEAVRDAFTVRKRRGTTEPYDRQKLADSLRRSVSDLPVGNDAVEEVLARINRRLMREGFGTTITSEHIGEVVLAELARLPSEGEMASVRYALYFYDQDDRSVPIGATEFARWYAERHSATGISEREVSRLVLKRGRRAVEPFDRVKLAESVELAMRGRKSPSATGPIVEAVCCEVELSLANQGIVTSTQIGTVVAAHLRATDPLAYLRYATIFKRLGSLAHFTLETAVAFGPEELHGQPGAAPTSS